MNKKKITLAILLGTFAGGLVITTATYLKKQFKKLEDINFDWSEEEEKDAV